MKSWIFDDKYMWDNICGTIYVGQYMLAII